MNMQAKQLSYLLISVTVLLLLGLFGIAYGTNKLLGGQATKLGKLKADNEVVSTLEATLAKNKHDITKYSDLNTIAQTIVPQDKDQAEAVREIVKLASQSGIPKLSSIAFPSSTLGTTKAGTPATNPNLTQLAPVLGVPGVYELQITISQTATDSVPYDKFTAFLSKLEQNRRTAQVSSISIEPTTGQATNIAFTLVINEFIKP